MKTKPRHKSYDTSMATHRGISWRDLTTWLGAVLLVFNTLAGSLAPVAGAAWGQNPFGEPMEVCTSHGLALADSSQPASESHETCRDCLCCLPLLHGGVVPPATVAIAPIAMAIGEAFPPADPRHVIPARQPDSAAPRAPPTA